MFYFSESVKCQKRDVIRQTVEKDLDEAFFMLGAEYKENPDFETMHNFGTLLSKFGNEITFFSKRNIAFAKKLLLEAKEQNASFITLKELGDLYLFQRKYRSAISEFTEALKQKNSYCVCYNLAECYYRSGDFVSMKKHLEQAVKKNEFSQEQRASLFELLGLAFIMTGDKEQGKNLLDRLQDIPCYTNEPDTLKLAYLCDYYSFVVNNYRKVFDGWWIDPEDCKIVYQSYCRTQNAASEEFKDFYFAHYLRQYADNPEIEPGKKVDFIGAGNCSAVSRIAFKIALPPAVFSCDFY